MRIHIFIQIKTELLKDKDFFTYFSSSGKLQRGYRTLLLSYKDIKVSQTREVKNSVRLFVDKTTTFNRVILKSGRYF